MIPSSNQDLVEEIKWLDHLLPLYSNQHEDQVWKLRQLVAELIRRKLIVNDDFEWEPPEIC